MMLIECQVPANAACAACHGPIGGKGYQDADNDFQGLICEACAMKLHPHQRDNLIPEQIQGILMSQTASSWVATQCKFASSDQTEMTKLAMSEGDGEGDVTQDYVQWMTSNNKVFAPASNNVEKLKPGFYEIRVTMNGLFFVRIGLKLDELIKFPDTTSDKVVHEIETFWDREPLFKDAKLAFKRGMLLYGPPGSGKSCTIKLVIQNIVKRGGVVINFEDPGSFKAGMKILREIQPETPVVVLMEDIDAILDRNNESDVINIIDGVTPMEKVVFLATTNYPERLGSRIMNRPSRFDKRFEIGMPNSESRRLYLSSKLGEKLSGKELEKWVKDSEGMSIAHLKELIVAVKILGDDYEAAIATLRAMEVPVSSSEFDQYSRKRGPRY